jgi:DNA-binding transcriptional regulator YiaG
LNLFSSYYELKIGYVRTIFAVEMSDPEIEDLINALREWCKAKHGRNAEIAETLGVSRQLVTDWLKGRAVPTLSTGLKLKTFLKNRRPRKAE